MGIIVYYSYSEPAQWFFYASIYYTDFSVGFSIILLFLCILWSGYFSEPTEAGELNKAKILNNLKTTNKSKELKKLELREKFAKLLKKNRVLSTSLFPGLINTFLPTTGLSRVLYRVGDFFLLREVSTKLILYQNQWYAFYTAFIFKG